MAEAGHTHISIHSDIGEAEKITHVEAQEYLHSPYPAWHLDPKGVIIGANLLAFWLWEVQQLNSKNFFGVTAFKVFYRNLSRIELFANEEFFKKKLPVLHRLVLSNKRDIYEPFLTYIETHPNLKQIYDQEYIADEKWHHKRVWQYILKVEPPHGTKGIKMLELEVIIYRLESSQTSEPGFVAVYEPHDADTRRIVQQKYELLKPVQDMIEYVQYKDGEKRGGEVTITKEQGPERKSKETYQPKKVTFADEYARMDFEIAEAIKGLNTSIPAETRGVDGSYPLIPIKFTPEHDAKGEIALFYTGDFMNAQDINENETIYHIRPKTKQILDALNISYNNLSPQTEVQQE